jgi:hypothetical protein
MSEPLTSSANKLVEQRKAAIPKRSLQSFMIGWTRIADHLALILVPL